MRVRVPLLASSPGRLLATLALLGALLPGCGDRNAGSPGVACAQDGSCPSGLSCFPDWRCYAASATPGCDPPCYGAHPFCLQAQLRCVDCLVDTDCPAGTLCTAPNMRCLAGCSAAHPGCTGGVATCDVDLGVCRGCTASSDCGDPAAPVCDVGSGVCSRCSTDPDSCGAGAVCTAGSDGSLGCVAGCKTRADCGGVGDCCGHRCIDVASDGNNCGLCGYACGGGSTCCGGRCVDVTTDYDHCGSCGHSCVLPNARGFTCAASACGWGGGCEDYFANCDHDPANGCEVNLTMDADNCYACGSRCAARPHAQPRCTVQGCVLGPCLAGWADCDGLQGDGCEYDVTGFASDTANCGGCGKACAPKQVCASGVCK